MSHDPAVQAALDSGQIATRELIRFDLPGKVAAYHAGGRPYTYNGVTYLPNRWLQIGEMKGDLGIAVTAREIVFSDIPVEDPDDAIAALELYDYTNAPVIITYLVGMPNSNEAIGILASHIYEINEVRYEEGAAGENGEKTLTVIIELEAPGRSARGTTAVMRAQEEQQFDNLATDTCLEYASVVQTVPVEWGQRSG